MRKIIANRVVYSAKGKVEGIVHKAKLHERIAAGIDRDDLLMTIIMI
jgi:hypothetical protein